MFCCRCCFSPEPPESLSFRSLPNQKLLNQRDVSISSREERSSLRDWVSQYHPSMKTPESRSLGERFIVPAHPREAEKTDRVFWSIHSARAPEPQPSNPIPIKVAEDGDRLSLPEQESNQPSPAWSDEGIFVMDLDEKGQ